MMGIAVAITATWGADSNYNIIKDNWSGEEDVLELISRITAVSEEFLDKNLLKKIRNIINKIKK